MLDVLVAGAGPAGTIAATLLARAGARVLVLERARLPRHKLCGDSVNPGAVAVLRRLGLGDALEGALPIGGMLVTSARVAVTTTYGGPVGVTIRREQLDWALARAAVTAGAGLDEEVLVDAPLFDGASRVVGLRVKRGGRPADLPARLVIAADGRSSRVARAAGLSRAARRPRRWAVGAYFEGVEGLAARGEMHVRAGHYLGVAPLPGGLANACLVTADRRILADARSALDRTLRADPRLGPRFAAARRVSPCACLGPLAVDACAAGMPGLLLAGDAAGFIDPMTGDGLRFAFAGGELAAVHALEALAHGAPDAHTRLAAARRRAFGGKWRFNRVLRLLVSHPAGVRGAALGAAVAPALLREVVRRAGDLPRAA